MRDGLPAQPLYRVRFRQHDVWPDYRGGPNDVLEVEIYQHWLEEP
jgi:nitrile hydratase